MVLIPASSQEEFEGQLSDYLLDYIRELCPELEQNPTLNIPDKIYSLCENCGHEDCPCCEYGRGY